MKNRKYLSYHKLCRQIGEAGGQARVDFANGRYKEFDSLERTKEIMLERIEALESCEHPEDLRKLLLALASGAVFGLAYIDQNC